MNFQILFFLDLEKKILNKKNLFFIFSYFGIMSNQNSTCVTTKLKWIIYSLLPPKMILSWRLCNAYSQTLRLYSSDILCFSLHFWILI